MSIQLDKNWEQDKEYNCGVFAVKFLIKLYNDFAFVDLSKLEVELGTNEELGTTHKAISDYLLKDYKITEMSDSLPYYLNQNLPAIVNYQSEEGGHYAVIISKIGENYLYYDPAYGLLSIISIDLFDKAWYSDLYGSKWFLHIRGKK